MSLAASVNTLLLLLLTASLQAAAKPDTEAWPLQLDAHWSKQPTERLQARWRHSHGAILNAHITTAKDGTLAALMDRQIKELQHRCKDFTLRTRSAGTCGTHPAVLIRYDFSYAQQQASQWTLVVQTPTHLQWLSCSLLQKEPKQTLPEPARVTTWVPSK